MTESNPSQKPAIDWTVIEREYRAGIKTLEQIGRENGVSKGRISQIAKRDAWPRDILKKIQAKADARVNEAAVNKELNKTANRLAEHQVIEANADLQSGIRLAHRGDIGKLRVMVMHMSAELERQNLDPELFKELVLLAAGIEKGQGIADITDEKQKATAKLMMESLRKTLALSSRTTNLRSLVDSFGRLVALEREAYGIKSDEPTTQDEFSSMLYKIANANSSAFKPIQNDPEHE